MHFPIFKVIAVIVGAAFAAALGMFRRAFRLGEAPSNDGPRALIAEFLGYWVGTAMLFWSFMVSSKSIKWELRTVALAAALLGIGLSVYFANTHEVPDLPDKEPTGFKNDATDLHLE